MQDQVLSEARRLYDLGWGIHFIKPGSKAPVKAGWSGPTRDDWATLERDYRPGYGLGVRLGAASKVEGGYLANIDIDVKSGRPEDWMAATQVIGAKFGAAIVDSAPRVVTGHGQRLFVVTKEPVDSGRIGASALETVVKMPTAEVNKRQMAAVVAGKLTNQQLKDGYRIRSAWEVEFMSAGKQVVLPPSIHPDTGKPYIWNGPNRLDFLPILDVSDLALGRASKVASITRPFKETPVDLVSAPLSGRIVDMILNGAGVEDRSAALFAVAIAMVKARFSDDEILTVLTDRSTFLGEVAFEHRRTDDRAYAAAWVRQYCLEKAKTEVDASRVFAVSVGITPTLEGDEVKAQIDEICDRDAPGTWQPARGGKHGDGAIVPNLRNTSRALTESMGPTCFREDLFAGRCINGVDTPWGGKAGEEFLDRDRPLLTEWIAKMWGFEPSAGVVFDAVSVIGARNAFHPIRDYLNGLVWDRTSRINSWLKTYMQAYEANELYLSEVSRKVLVGMVARAFEPGCKFDYMLVFQGGQGMRKSSALAVLSGDKYFSEAILKAGEKDTIAKMSSKWIIEYGEFSTAKADIKALKHFLTTRVDRDRLSYEHYARDFPRCCIFVGTTNELNFLRDETGDRRFWPVRTGIVDLEGLKRDRDQLLAEAKFYYDMGEVPALSDEAEAEARVEQAKYRPEDVMVERVALVLERNAAMPENEVTRFPDEGFTLWQVMERLNARDDLQTQHRVGQALRVLGYTKHVTRIKGRSAKTWWLTTE